MAVAGYNTQIYIGGTVTAFTGETFTNTSGNIWQIDSTSKRVWSPGTVPTFYDNGIAISAGDISAIDYLFGIVTFTGSKSGPITADGDYVPLLSIAGGYSAGVTMSAADLDCSVFGAAYVQRIIGLADLSFSAEIWDVLTTDQDPGGGTRKLLTVYNSQTLILASFRPDSNANEAIRSWGYLTKAEQKAGVADMVGGSIEFVSTTRFDSAGRSVSYSKSS